MVDLFGYDPGRPEGDAALEMEVRFHPDDRNLARLELVYTWDRALPAAAWLMNNPSVAGRPALPSTVAKRATFDPTARRVIHFSRMVGAGSARLFNWCPLVATDPADLWRMIREERFTRDLYNENRVAIRKGVASAPIVFLACGPEGMRRHPALVWGAIKTFLASELVGVLRAPLALGVTDHGAPLHPLARGKFAIPNDRRPVAFDLEKWKAAGDAWQ